MLDFVQFDVNAMVNGRFSPDALAPCPEPLAENTMKELSRVKCRRFNAFFSLIALLLILILVGCEGSEEFRKGKEQASAKNFDDAVINFKKALDKNPDSLEYQVYYERARLKAGLAHNEKGQKLEKEAKYAEALAEYQQGFTIDPGNNIAHKDYDRLRLFIENPNKPKEPPNLQDRINENLTDPNRTVEISAITRTPITLKITDEAKRIYETIAKLAGINVVFDPDFLRASSERISVELNNVTLTEALEILAIRTKTFWKPLNSTTILVIPDNQGKRRDYEDQIIKTIYLSNSLASTDLTETLNAMRQLLELRRVVQSNSLNAIIIRDTPDKVAIAERLIQSIDKGKPEVIIDVAVMEIDRTRARDLGITPLFGSSLGVGTTATFNNSLRGATVTSGSSTGSTGSTTGGTTTTTTPGTVPINRLGRLTGGSFSVIIPAAQAQALRSDTRGRVLQNPQLRASDGKLAKIRIGQKVPISTGSFTPFTGGGATAGNIFSQFQYQDVGVNLDITPKVHLNREITLTVKVEISSIAGQQNFSGLLEPIFNNRSVEQEITLKEGEANVLAGIISDEDRKVISGIPGLSQIPFFRWLFSNEHSERNQQEFIIVMTPHIVRLPQFDDMNLQGLYVGTETVTQLKNKLPRLGEGVPGSAVASTTPSVPAPAVTPKPETGAPPAQAPRPALETAPSVRAASFRLNPPTGTYPAGNPFSVTLTVDNIQNLFSTSFSLAWDPKVIRLKDVSGGEFLERDEEPVALVERPDNDTGTLVVTLSRPPEVSGISGSGTLVTITFEPVSAGRTSLTLSQVAAKDNNGERISAIASSAQIVIQ